jgi:hypothetical protein
VSWPLPPYDDETWQAIIKAARPYTPDEGARAALNEILYRYDKFQVLDPKQIKEARAAWEAVAANANRAADEAMRIRDAWPGAVWSDEDQAALLALRQAQRQADHRTEGLNRSLASQKGQGKPDREWLLSQLIGIWQRHFGGHVRISVNNKGVPGGPLIRFISAVTHALAEPVNPHTFRTEIRRYKRDMAV